MRKTDVLEYFGTTTAVAEAAGVSVPAVSQWGERVPLGSAAVLERVTGGRLRLDMKDYRRLPDQRDREAEQAKRQALLDQIQDRRDAA